MKKWIPLFVTNLLGVFNDNFLKNLICFISFTWLLQAAENQSLVISIASGLFVIPYILFSPYAGILAKRISKTKIIVIAKFAEIPIMLIASLAFFMESIYLVMISLFLMGLQSAMFSPSKYGLIRDIGGEEGVSFGTGTMELITFFSVQAGFFMAGRIADVHTNQIYYIIAIFNIIALMGFIASKFIKAEEPPVIKEFKDTINPFLFIKRSFAWSKQNNKGLNWVVISLSTFWLIGSLIQMNLYVYCPQYLNMSNSAIGNLMGLMGIGIGLGCFLAGLLSKKKVMIRFIPLGAAGLSLFLTLMYFLKPNVTLFSVYLILAAVFSGFYKIPLNAWIQTNVKGRKLGEMLAFNNLMVFLFLLISAGLYAGLSVLLDPKTMFLFIAAVSWIIGIVMFFKIPDLKNQMLHFFKNKKTNG